MLRRRLLDYVRRMAVSKTYFSNATYSIIYKLLEEKRLLIAFMPKIRVTKFFVNDSSPISVIGGYNYNTRKIEILVKWAFGIEAIYSMFESHLPLICNKVFAIILSEALLVYDYRHNGELSKSDLVKRWYKTYFENVFEKMLTRKTVVSNLSTVVSDDYGARLFTQVEKAIVEGRSPSVKIDRIGANAELDIEGIPSIKKGSKILEDIFGDCIEDAVIDNKDAFNIDDLTQKELKDVWSNFAEFGAFIYNNRDLALDPQYIAADPSEPLDLYQYKNYDKLTYREELKQQRQQERQTNRRTRKRNNKTQ